MANTAPFTPDPNVPVWLGGGKADSSAAPTSSQPMSSAANPTPAAVPDMASGQNPQPFDENAVINPAAWEDVTNTVRTKLESNNKLIAAKNAVFKHMYDQPLTKEERGALTPELEVAMQKGDRNMLDNAISSINSQIKGYNNTIDTNLAAYTAAVTQTNNLKMNISDHVATMLSNGTDPNSIAAYLSGASGGIINPADYGLVPKTTADGQGGTVTTWTVPSAEDESSHIQEWVSNINSGKATLSNVPTNLRNKVSDALSGTQAITPAQQAKTMSVSKGYPKLIKGGGGGGLFGIGKSDAWAYIDPKTSNISYANSYDEAIQQQNQLNTAALGLNSQNSTTINGINYNPGDTMVVGDVTLTLNSDGQTFSGSDGNTYDSTGNIVNQ